MSSISEECIDWEALDVQFDNGGDNGGYDDSRWDNKDDGDNEEPGKKLWAEGFLTGTLGGVILSTPTSRTVSDMMRSHNVISVPSKAPQAEVLPTANKEIQMGALLAPIIVLSALGAFIGSRRDRRN